MSNQYEEQVPAELDALAASLKSLVPAPASLDRDRLMFDAGRASVTSRSQQSTFATLGNWSLAWPLATAALLLLSLSFGWRLIEVAGQPERIVYVERSAATHGEQTFAKHQFDMPSTSLAKPSANSYFALRARGLARGLDALPQPPADDAGDAPAIATPQLRAWFNNGG